MHKHIIVYSKHILLHHVASLGGPDSPRRILKIYSISTVDCTAIFRSLQYMFSLLTGLLGPQRQKSLKFVQVCCCWVSTGKQELALNTHWSANKLFKYFRVPCHWDPQIDRCTMTSVSINWFHPSFPGQTTATKSNHCVSSIPQTHQGAMYNIVSSVFSDFTLFSVFQQNFQIHL